MSLDFESIFHNYVQANKRVFSHDRSKTLGASETFSCLRRSWFTKFGEAAGFIQDEDEAELSWGAMERGNVIENAFVVPAFRHSDLELLYAGEEQETLVDGLNSATLDGLITGLKSDALKKYGINDIESDCIVLEIKSIDPRVSLDEEKAVHHGQAQVQLGIVRALTEFKPVYAVIIYVDASFLDVIYPFVVKYDPLKYKAGKTRARILFEEVGADGYPGDIHPEGKLSDECRYCPWFGACSAVTKNLIPTEDDSKNLDSETISQMEGLIFEQRNAKRLEEDAHEVNESVKQRIKDMLVANSTKRMRSLPKKKGSNEPTWSVSWSSLDGKETLDKDAAKAAGIDLQKYMKSGNPYDRLTITTK